MVPGNVASRDFIEHKYEYFPWLREHAPVFRGRMFVLPVYLLSRYQDCADMLRDERFVRDRSHATGRGGKFPFPIPASMRPLTETMIAMDNPDHRRLRRLINKAFTPRALGAVEGMLTDYADELLDSLAGTREPVDLMQRYALPIPVRVISRLLGVSDDDMPFFQNSLHALTDGLSGLSIFRTFLFDMPRTVQFTRDLIARKRAAPADDLLSLLIAAEEDGDRLTEDELVAMSFLLVFAGYETTVHLITNGVLTLLGHPAELDKLRRQPSLADGAVEEILRFRGPVHGTKPNFPCEDIELHGFVIPRGSVVIPLLGAANRDPAVFDDPERFNIERAPNRHLAFGYGIHLCLGAWLARLETKIALNALLARFPDLSLAVEPASLRVQRVPFWHRYTALPVRLNA